MKRALFSSTPSPIVDQTRVVAIKDVWSKYRVFCFSYSGPNPCIESSLYDCDAYTPEMLICVLQFGRNLCFDFGPYTDIRVIGGE